jgi:hypothetical protein
MKRCPKCNSKDVEVVDEEMGFIKCKKCGFDELKEYEGFDEVRRSQREKAKFSPYRQVGGKRRK